MGISTAAVITKDNKILLGLRHYPPEILDGASVWTTPGGKCDEGESIEEGLLREILEETGVENPEVVKFLGKVESVLKGELHVYHCITEEEPILMEPQKFSEWAWFPLNELPENFINPNMLPLFELL